MKNRIICLIICTLLITIFFSGFSNVVGAESWPQFHYNAENLGVTTSLSPNTNTIIWEFETNDLIESSPAIVNSKVYIGSTDGKVYCLNSLTGEKIWSFSTGEQIGHSSPAVVNGKVYIGSDKVYCIHADTGEEIWEYSTNFGFSDSSPAVVDDRIYICSTEDYIYCLDATSGDFIWKHYLERCYSDSPAVSDGYVYVVTLMPCVFYCLDAEGKQDGTTTELWNYPMASLSLFTSPVVSDERVYVCDKDVYCFDAKPSDGIDEGIIESNGLYYDLIWISQTNGSIHSTPALAYGNIYTTSDDGKFYCFNATDGTKIWESPGGTYAYSSPAVSDGKVFFGKTSQFRCIDAYTGSYIWSWNGFSGESSPAIVDGVLYIGSGKSIFALRDNTAPTKPVILSGSRIGNPNTVYTFSTTTSDSENDKLYYMFDWGDETPMEWQTSPFGSHQWTQTGLYDVQVKAKDLYGAESDWSDIQQVSISASIQELTFSVSHDSVVKEGDAFSLVIRDRLSMVPLNDVSVVFDQQVYQSDTEGIVTFSAPDVSTNKEYSIMVFSEGYVSYTSSVLVLNQGISHGLIYGMVSDSDRNVLSGVRVCVKSSKESSSTVQKCVFTKAYDQGVFFSLQVDPGEYTITVEKTGYQSAVKKNIIVNQGDTVQVDFSISSFDETSESISNTDDNQLLSYIIDQQAQQGNVGAQVSLKKDQSEVSVYLDDFNIVIEHCSDQVFSLKVDAPNGTTGKLVFIDVAESVFSDLNTINDMVISFDGLHISRKPLSMILSGELVDPAWAGVISFDDKGNQMFHVIVFIPHFSEHQILITYIVTTVGIFVLLAIYLSIFISGASAYYCMIYRRVLRVPWRKTKG